MKRRLWNTGGIFERLLCSGNRRKDACWRDRVPHCEFIQAETFDSVVAAVDTTECMMDLQDPRGSTVPYFAPFSSRNSH